MKFISPITITDALFVSSTAPETDFAEWSGVTTYALGAKVIKTATHRIYQSVQASNLNRDPATDTAATWWVNIGPTNRWAMLDQTVGTVTSQGTPLTVVIAPGIIDSLALLDVSGTQVVVKQTEGATVIYDKTYDMSDHALLLDWYMYYYTPILPNDTLIVSDLIPSGTAQLSVEIDAATTAKCGTLAVGAMVDVGATRYGAKVGIIDFSVKATDIYGVTTVVQRTYAKRVEVDLFVESAWVDYVARQLALIRSVPVVWIGDPSNQYSSMVVYGFFNGWETSIDYPTLSLTHLTIEGLT